MNTASLTLTKCAFTLSILLAACGGKGETELLDSAKAYLAKKDTKAAVIQLKTALQKHPDSGETRYLLGKTMLETGDPAAAALELQKSADLKYNISLVIPQLAKAWLEQGEYKKVIDQYAQFALPDAAAQAELKTTLATAYARQGSSELADTALQAAFASAPNLPSTLLLKARMLADKKDFAQSQGVLDQVITREPGNYEAWLLKGEINHYGSNDRPAALAAYRKALEYRPDLVNAHKGLITVLLAEQNNAGASSALAQMKTVLPNHPQTLFFEAQMAFIAREYKTAQSITQRLVQVAPNNPLVLQLAGAVEYQLRSYPQAETLLSKALQAAPALPIARVLLAQTYLRTGQPNKTLSTLAPMLDKPEVSGDVLAVAAEAHLQAGDAKKSEELFARAAKAKPDDPKIRTARALGQMAQGKSDSAMAELETVAGSDSGTLADMALISAHLRRNELDKALKAIDGLEKKQPDKPMAANLRGRIQAMRKDNAAARASFERALTIDKNYFPAVASLAALDMIEKGPAAARQRFDDLLKADPKNLSALMAVSNLVAATGGSKEDVTAYLTKAVKENPTQAAPRLLLVDRHLAQKDFKAALAVAQEGLAALADNPDLLQAVGRVHLASGDTQQAITTFNKLAALQPQSPIAPMALGETYLSTKDFDNAVRSFKKALVIKPDLLPAQRALIGIAVHEKRNTDALEIAKAVQKQQPQSSVGQLLEGEIEAARKNWDAAAAAYRAALQKSKTSEGAIRLHMVLVNAGKADEGDKFSASWTKEQPKDGLFLFHLGDLALAKRDFALAESRYRTVTAIQPENALALNNIAWLMVKQGKPGAVELAEKANKLQPNRAVLMDTLATTLAAEKQLPRALEVQKSAIALDPADNGLRLNLARILIQSGDKAAAKTELQALEKLGSKFGDQESVSQLLKSVNS